MNTRNAVSALAATAILTMAITAPAQSPPAPPTASASAEPDENTQRFVRGVKLFREGDFRSALVEFRRFYDATKNFKVLYNIGQAEFEVQDYAGALASFKRYLELGGAEIDTARKAEVEAEIKGLADRVASVHIESNVVGADVLIDDVVVGKTPLTAVTVSMGRRKVVVQKDGVSSPPRFLDLAGRDNTTVKIDLNAPQTAPTATSTSAPTAPGSAAPTAPIVETEPPSRTGLWISLAVTGGLVVGTAVVGGLALAAQGDAKNTLDKFGATADEIQSARSKTQTMALVADILGGTALAMTAVTIIIGVTGGKSESPAKASLLPTPKSAQIGLGPGKFVLQGSF